MTTQHARIPLILVGERCVHALPCLATKCVQLPSEALALRLVLHEESPVTRPVTVVSEPEEGERPGSRQAQPGACERRQPPKLDQLSLVLVQRRPKFL